MSELTDHEAKAVLNNINLLIADCDKVLRRKSLTPEQRAELDRSRSAYRWCALKLREWIAGTPF